jgi:uncharacterized protein YdcH (DUF465 family)
MKHNLDKQDDHRFYRTDMSSESLLDEIIITIKENRLQLKKTIFS